METNSSKTSPLWKSSNCLNRVSENVIRWRLRNMNHQIISSYGAERTRRYKKWMHKFVKRCGKGPMRTRAPRWEGWTMSGSVSVKLTVTSWLMRFRFVTVCTFGFHSSKGCHHVKRYRSPCHWAAGETLIINTKTPLLFGAHNCRSDM
jgi:hypothetical protein